MGSKDHTYVVVHPNTGSPNLSKSDYSDQVHKLEELINSNNSTFVLLSSKTKDFKNINAYKSVLLKFSKKNREPILLDYTTLSKNRGAIHCENKGKEVMVNIETRVAAENRIYITHPTALGYGGRAQYEVVVDAIRKNNELLPQDHIIHIVGRQFSAGVAQYAFEFNKQKFNVVVDLEYTDFSEDSNIDAQTLVKFKEKGIEVKK
jgi:hypothetical protein